MCCRLCRCVSNDAIMDARKPQGRSPPRPVWGAGARQMTRSPGNPETEGLDFDFLSATACDRLPHPHDGSSPGEETELHPLRSSSPNGVHDLNSSSEGVVRDPNTSPCPTNHRRGNSILAQLDLGDCEEERLLFGDGVPGPDAGTDRCTPGNVASPTHRRDQACTQSPDTAAGVSPGRLSEGCRQAATSLPPSAGSREMPNHGDLVGVQSSSPLREGPHSSDVPALCQVSAEPAPAPASLGAACGTGPARPDPPGGPLEALPSADNPHDRKRASALAGLFRTSGRPQTGQATTSAAAASARGFVADAGHLQAPASPPGAVEPRGPWGPLRAIGLPGLGSDSEAEELLFGSKLTETLAGGCASTGSRRSGNGLLQQGSAPRAPGAERGADSDLEEDLFGPCSPSTASLPSRYLEHRKRRGTGPEGAGMKVPHHQAVSTVRWVRNSAENGASAAGHLVDGAAELPRCTSSKEEDPLMAAGAEERRSEGEDGEAGEAEERSKGSRTGPKSASCPEQAAGCPGQTASGKEGATARQSRCGLSAPLPVFPSPLFPSASRGSALQLLFAINSSPLFQSDLTDLPQDSLQVARRSSHKSQSLRSSVTFLAILII